MNEYRIGANLSMSRAALCALVAPFVVLACGESSSDDGSGGAAADGGGKGGAGAMAGAVGGGAGSSGVGGSSVTAGRGGGGASGSGASGGSRTGGSGGDLAGSDAGGSPGSSGEENGGDAGASAGRAGGGGAAGSGGGSGGCGPCDWECCGSTCVNHGNDIKNCGECGNECEAGQACNDGVCGDPECTAPIPCMAGQFCCGTTCCDAGRICCTIPGPVGPSLPTCTEPNELGTCPTGCRTCKCASPNTPIATPTGERAISELQIGDLVYSVEREAVVAVPIVALHREPAFGHAVPRLLLDNGRALDVSAGHPTADGRVLGEVSANDPLGDVRITSVVYVAYPYAFTYDILPASSTGAYYAAGALIGSTLNQPGSACR
jgi:hypothetical protein